MNSLSTFSSFQVDDLYLIAIVNKRNIRSLRDLRSEHLPLLKNVFQKGQVRFAYYESTFHDQTLKWLACVKCLNKCLLLLLMLQEIILQQYNLPACKLRAYLHYQPSYYHLHFYFTKLSYEAPGCGMDCAHLLADVIQNLHFNSDYYKSRTLYFPLSEDHGLLHKFKEAGRL